MTFTESNTVEGLARDMLCGGVTHHEWRVWLARVPGFEPGACRLGGGCSIQLSYTRTSSLPLSAVSPLPTRTYSSYRCW